MRNENLLDRDAVLRGRRFQTRDIPPRIGEGTAHGLRAPDQAAVLLERCHRNDGSLERRIGGHISPCAAVAAARQALLCGTLKLP